MGFRKNVFVLGAGFSRDAGTPLMSDFLARARDLRDDPNSPLTAQDKKVFTRVMEYRFELNKALAKVFVDLDNIEQLFGFLEMQVQLSPEASTSLRTDMAYLIVRTLEASTQAPLATATGDCRVVAGPKGGNKWSYYYPGNRYSFFVGFAGGLWNPSKRKGQRVIETVITDHQSVDSIITFNYDLVLEREMAGLGIVPLYHCPAGDYHDAFPGANLGLNLLKMHGSANWLVCADCRGQVHVRSPEKAAISQVVTDPCPTCHQASLMPLVVPPTWNKGIEEKLIRPVWSKALGELMTAGRLFIVGYSFPETDQFFKYMLGLALATNNNLTEIYVVNSSDQVYAKFQNFFNPHFHERVVQYRPKWTNEFISGMQDLTKQEFDEAHLARLFKRG